MEAHLNESLQRAQDALYHQYTTTNDTLNDAINRVDGIDQAKPWDTETTGAKHLALGIHDAFTVNSTRFKPSENATLSAARGGATGRG